MHTTLTIPNLPAVAVLHTRPELRAQPLAITQPDAHKKSPVISTNPIAAAFDVIPGIPATRALARCPQLHILERNPANENLIHTQLLTFAQTLSPDIESTRPGTIIADLTTLPQAIKNPNQWLVETLAKKFPFPLHIATAPTPDLADITAHTLSPENPIHHLAQPRELHQTPVQNLAHLTHTQNLTEILTQLDSWGIHTIGELIALPHAELVDRLGHPAGQLQNILNGNHNRLLNLHRPPQDFCQTIHPEHQPENLQQLTPILGQIIKTLTTRLLSAQLAAASIHIHLTQTDTKSHRANLRVAEPTTDHQHLATILNNHLQTVITTAPTETIHLRLQPTLPTAAQKHLFTPTLRDPNSFQQTLTQIAAIVGPQNIGIPIPADSHHPDSHTLHPYGTTIPEPSEHPLPPPSLPLTRIRPPQRIAVAYSQDNQTPAAVLTGQHTGPIVQTRGPYHLSGQWWQKDKTWKRTEWDIQLKSHHLLRIVQTHTTPKQWFLEGIYP